MKIRKALLSCVLVLATALVCVIALHTKSNATTIEFAGGSGTESDPYLIETKEHLNNVRNNLIAHYRLVADIEFAEVDFTANGSFYNDGSGFIPIGSKDEAFCGFFDGNGYSISNLLIYNSSTSGDACAGLFAINNGVVKNLGIENGNISVYPDSNQYAYCGSIAGKNLGTITDCYSTSTVWSRRYAGGIAGYNSGSISDCYNNGVITASKDFDLSAGGIVGYNYDGTISNCYNNGQISSSAIVVSTFTTTYYAFAGGIVGYGYDGTVEKCYNTGDIKATSNITSGSGYASANSGGIIGSNRSCNISQCYNIGAISSDAAYKSCAGGIAGSNASNIASCYNVGALTTLPLKGNNYPGGIAGNNSGSISTSYNVANAIENIASSNSGTIKNCYFHSETLSAGCKLASLFSVLTYQGFNFDSVWQMSDGDYPLPVLQSVKNYASFEHSPEENTVDFAGGKGTGDDPFVIKTITHLDNIRKYPSSYFVLANDITFDPENEAFATGWKPFAFKGYLDGQGYKITGIRITVSNTLEYQWRDPGLFASNDGTIKNLTVEDMRISVSNVGDKYGGFICAVNNGVIINCHSKSCTISLQNYYHFFGGIAGNNSGSIQNCTSNNTINWGANGGRIGGIAANNTGSIIGCTNNSTITNIGSYTPISGGISAKNNGDIICSNNLASIYTQSTCSQRSGYSGGVVGQMTGGQISQCYNLGAITTEATEYKANTYSSGIVAYISDGDILDCYNTGDIYGEPDSYSASCYVGGIVGYNNSIGTLENCYSIGGNSGRASSANLYVGYICGYNASNTIENCYYLGVVNNGSGSGDCSTMYGKNIAALKSQDTYTGFDFTGIWTTSGNSDYPFPELVAISMVYEKEVKSIQLDTMPTKLTYIENYELLNVAGGTIKVTYKYDEYDVISLSDASVSGFDNSVVGKQRITVSYLGRTTTFEVEIVKKSLERVEITTLPNKLIYTEGDSFDDTGMVVTAYYNDATSNVISGYAVSGYSPTPGTKNIIVSFDKKSISFTIVVYSTCEAKGHNYTDATCLAPEICSVCGATEGTALGHDYAAATCTTPKTCKVCGDTVGKALGHNYTILNHDDKTHWMECSCGAIDEENRYGHGYTRMYDDQQHWLECFCGEMVDVESHDYAAATCVAPKTCKTCGLTEGEAKGHTSDSGTVTKKATCTATGTKTYKCKDCGQTLKTETLAKISHNYTASTCGKTTKCSMCGKTGSKLAHTYTNACDTKCNRCSAKRSITHKYASATCTKAKTCKVCGKTSGSKLGHKYSNDCDTSCNRCGKTRTITHKYKSATCTKAKTCKICGKTSGSKLGHKYTNACDTKCNRCSKTRTIKHQYKSATCTKAKTCKICGKTSGSKLGHKYTNACDTSCNRCGKTRTIKHSYKAATCTKAKTCKVCGKTSGSKLGHKYSNDCDTSCNRCGKKRSITHDYQTKTTKATTSKNGKVVKKCAECGKISSEKTVYKIKSFSLSTSKYTYNGDTRTPTVTVKDTKGNKLKKDTDYTVSYEAGRADVGEYTVTVTLKGKYSGTKKLYFTIVPGKASISKLTAKSKALEVTLNTQTTQTSGYQIEYSTSKSFSSSKKITVSDVDTGMLVISGLKAKTTYYVRIRTYKTVDGEKFYSSWSDYAYKKTK